MNNVLMDMLKKYEIKNLEDETNAMKEIIQEITLCGLSRANFFDEAAFYGGTALRIFYGLDRFSEDLDFSLLTPNKDFNLNKYFTYIEKEAEAYGLNLSISTKEKSQETTIQSAFLKGDTKEHILIFFPNKSIQINDHLLKNIKIKFEIDINPPTGATYENKYKLLPSPHQVKLYDEASLFAGKIHAVLCRNWNYRTKGRDLYDYIFYLSKQSKVNLNLIKSKLVESKVIDSKDTFNIEILKKMLNKKFREINYNDAKSDIVPFIKDLDSLNLWSQEFFVEITKELKTID